MTLLQLGPLEDDVLVSGSNRINAGSVTLFKVDGTGNITRTVTLTAPLPIAVILWAICFFGREFSSSWRI